MQRSIGKRFPNQLRRYRRIAGFTQTDVAKKLKLRGTHRVSLWEKGETMPSAKNLIKLTMLYRTNVLELYGALLPAFYCDLGLAVAELCEKQL
jgi:transcriptional regulator with XRE-family HTH domain